MAERRTLSEGLSATPPPINPGMEKKFVYGEKANAENPAILSRVPISTRIRSDFAIALKRASLERQLKAEEPNTLQDILEEAIEPWLRNHGYLS